MIHPGNFVQQCTHNSCRHTAGQGLYASITTNCGTYRVPLCIEHFRQYVAGLVRQANCHQPIETQQNITTWTANATALKEERRKKLRLVAMKEDAVRFFDEDGWQREEGWLR